MRLSHRAVAQLCAMLVPLCVLLPSTAQADIVVPAGGSMSLASGILDLGCTDVTIGGTLLVNGGVVVNARNVILQAGGLIDGGSGSITLAGNWANSGTFVPGIGTVAFVDNASCASASTITGSTAFYNLSLVSTAGKIYTFAAGLVQSVSNALTITGVSGTPLRIVSSVPGTPAYLLLASGGTQNISHVSVSDNWATGQPLATNQSNEGGGGSVRGWFGIALNLPIPTLGDWNLLLLIFMLGAAGMAVIARRLPKSKVVSSRSRQ